MSLKEFHKTTSAELIAITNRVRQLIVHWGEDGRYKEAVLKNMIEKFLPKTFLIGTGFVIKQTQVREEHLPSKQAEAMAQASGCGGKTMKYKS